MTSLMRKRVAPSLGLPLFCCTLIGCSAAHTVPSSPAASAPWHATPGTISLSPLLGWTFDGLAEQRDRKRGDGVLLEVAVEGPASGGRPRVERFLVEASFLDGIVEDETMKMRFTPTVGPVRRFEIPLTHFHFGWVESDKSGSPSSMAAFSFGQAPEWGTRAGLLEEHDPHGREIAPALTNDERKFGFYAYSVDAGLALSGNELCQRLLLKIAKKPSWWSILTSRNLTVGIRTTQGESAEPTTILLDGQRFEGVRQPMQIIANDKPAVLLDVYAVPIRGPLGITSGIVLVEARHPSNQNRRATLRLAGTRSVELEAGDLPPSTLVGWGQD